MAYNCGDDDDDDDDDDGDGGCGGGDGNDDDDDDDDEDHSPFVVHLQIKESSSSVDRDRVGRLVKKYLKKIKGGSFTSSP